MSAFGAFLAEVILKRMEAMDETTRQTAAFDEKVIRCAESWLDSWEKPHRGVEKEQQNLAILALRDAIRARRKARDLAAVVAEGRA